MPHRNRASFLEETAADIARVDAQRGLSAATLPIATDANLLNLEQIGYGAVRAADIWNRAYDKIQNFRFAAAGLCLFGGVLPAFPAFMITNLESSSIVMDVSTASLFGGVVAAATFAVRSMSTARRYGAQCDPNIEYAPIDKTLSRKANRLLGKYVRNIQFAQSIPYGEGFTHAAPIVVNRILSQIEESKKQPLFSDWTEEQLTLAIVGAFGKQKPVAMRNRFDISEDIMARLMQLKNNNPNFQPTLKDFRAIFLGYDKAFASVNRRWDLVMQGGCASALAGPISAFLYATKFSGNAASWIADNPGITVSATAGPLLMVAAYGYAKSLLSRRTNNAQFIGGALNPNAPADRPVALRADKLVYEGLQRLIRAKSLTP